MPPNLRNFKFPLLLLWCLMETKALGRLGPTPVPNFHYITQLALAELDIYPQIKQFANTTPHRAEIAEPYLTDYEDSTGIYLKDWKTQDKMEKAMAVASHPFLGVRLLKRFAFNLPIIIGTSRAMMDAESGMIKVITDTEATTSFPSYKVWEDYIGELFKMQYVYGMRAVDMAHGKILGKDTKIGFAARHSLDMTNYSIWKEYFYLALEWLKETQILAKAAYAKNNKTQKITVDLSYMKLISKHDNNFLRYRAKQHRFMFSKKITVHPNDAPPLKTIMMERYKNVVMSDSPHAQHYREIRLCQGEELRDHMLTKNLKCRYAKHIHPYFKIVPLKLEQVSHEPEIILFHDVLQEKWVKSLMTEEIEKMRRKNFKEGLNLSYQDLNLLPLKEKLEMISGLKLDLHDGLRIAVNTLIPEFGTSYEIRKKPTKDEATDENFDPYLATFLLALKDSLLGGRIIFPKIGVTLDPPKGSFLYWINNEKNGERDERTDQVFCPVALGVKWNAVVRPLKDQNFLNYLCDFDPLK